MKVKGNGQNIGLHGVEFLRTKLQMYSSISVESEIVLRSSIHESQIQKNHIQNTKLESGFKRASDQ